MLRRAALVVTDDARDGRALRRRARRAAGWCGYVAEVRGQLLETRIGQVVARYSNMVVSMPSTSRPGLSRAFSASTASISALESFERVDRHCIGHQATEPLWSASSVSSDSAAGNR